MGEKVTPALVLLTVDRECPALSEQAQSDVLSVHSLSQAVSCFVLFFFSL